MLLPIPATLPAGLGLLVLAVGLLALGPVLWSLARRWAAVAPLLDGVVLGGIGLLALGHILPEAVHGAGLWALAAAGAGLLLPTLAERVLRHETHSGAHDHGITVALVVLGLALHAALDGVALALGGLHPEAHGSENLTGAVLLHRLPVGLAIWALLRPGRSASAPAAALAGIAAATAVGFGLAETLAPLLHGTSLALFQALVAGSLLHVVLHRHVPEAALGAGSAAVLGATAAAAAGDTDASPRQTAPTVPGAPTPRPAALSGSAPPSPPSPSAPARSPRAPLLETMGAALAVVAVLLPRLASGGSLGSPYTHRLLALALDSAPPLLAGYLLAGVVKELLPASAVGWLQRGRPAGQSLRGMIFGIPLPICSCGVVPLYQGLVQRGVPATGAMAFLVATPEIGVESIFLSVVLMGLPFTGVRLGAAALLAFGVGYVVGRRSRATASPFSMALGDAPPARQTAWARLRAALRYGFGEVLTDTAAWILLGLLVAAALDPATLGPWLARIPDGLDVLVFAGLGIPVYVCASGATPLAAGLLWAGVSPGAALAFLLAGPATNVTTFGVLTTLHGRAVALSFAGFMLAGTALIGLGVNALLPGLRVSTPPPPSGDHASWLAWACLLVLGAAFGRVLLRLGPRQMLASVLPGVSPS